MTRYEIFKFLHIVGAIAWLGGGLGFFVLSRSLAGAGDYAGITAINRQSKALGTRLFMPASLVTIVFGVLMVATNPGIGFGDLWILIGFGGIVGSGVVTMAFAEPAARRFGDLVAEHGNGTPEVAAAYRRVSFTNVADVVVLFTVVWAMVARPTL